MTDEIDKNKFCFNLFNTNNGGIDFLKNDCLKCKKENLLINPISLCLDCYYKSINKKNKLKFLMELLLTMIFLFLPFYMVGIKLGIKTELIAFVFYILGIIINPLIKWLVDKI